MRKFQIIFLILAGLTLNMGAKADSNATQALLSTLKPLTKNFAGSCSVLMTGTSWGHFVSLISADGKNEITFTLPTEGGTVLTDNAQQLVIEVEGQYHSENGSFETFALKSTLFVEKKDNQPSKVSIQIVRTDVNSSDAQSHLDLNAFRSCTL